MNALGLILVLSQVAAPRPTPVPTITPTAQVRPAPKLGGGFGQRPVASGNARVVVTDDTLAPARKGGTLSVSGRSTSAVVSVDGPDEEAVWRARVAGLREALKAAQAEYDRADASNTVTAFGRLGHDYDTLMAIRDAALLPYRVRLMELRQELSGLPEECRKTPGCQPGWVR